MPSEPSDSTAVAPAITNRNHDRGAPNGGGSRGGAAPKAFTAGAIPAELARAVADVEAELGRLRAGGLAPGVNVAAMTKDLLQMAAALRDVQAGRERTQAHGAEPDASDASDASDVRRRATLRLDDFLGRWDTLNAAERRSFAGLVTVGGAASLDATALKRLRRYLEGDVREAAEARLLALRTADTSRPARPGRRDPGSPTQDPRGPRRAV